MIVVDTTFLIYLVDPSSTQDGDRLEERVRFFVNSLDVAPQEIVVAAPSIAELVAGRATRIDEIVATLKSVKAMSIQPFDLAISIETGDRIAAAVAQIPENEKLAGWKVAMKYDAMIASTAIVRGATALITKDSGFDRYLAGSEVKLMMIGDLPLPPENPQRSLWENS